MTALFGCQIYLPKAADGEGEFTTDQFSPMKHNGVYREQSHSALHNKMNS
jgi:hypothetical protein